jgi:hypothetical protein
MWHFFNLTGVNQHQLVTQWIHLKDKTNKKRPYQLPVQGSENVPPSNALTTVCVSPSKTGSLVVTTKPASWQ